MNLIESASLLARILLIVVFFTSSVSKFSDLAGTRKTLIEFGLPKVFANGFKFLLPLSEIAIALALSTAFALWGALFAFILLTIFNIVVVANLLRGHTPDCNCFGQLHSTPIGKYTLIRNVLLAGVSCIVMRTGLFSYKNLELPSFFAIFSLWHWVIVLLSALGLFVYIQFTMWMKKYRALLAKKGLPIGLQPPAFQLLGLNEKPVSLNDLLAQGKPIILCFLNPTCDPCKELPPDIYKWQLVYADEKLIVPISMGSVKANKDLIQKYKLQNVLLQKNDEVAMAYEIPGGPAAVLIQKDGLIGSMTVFGKQDIEALVQNL